LLNWLQRLGATLVLVRRVETEPYAVSRRSTR
jgi:hypothetical protein